MVLVGGDDRKDACPCSTEAEQRKKQCVCVIGKDGHGKYGWDDDDDKF